MKQGERIAVALSGGVDSSVAAALLQEAGHDVTGVFIKVWQAPFLACTWQKERDDAARVAHALNIPFAMLNCEKEYEAEVVRYMVSEYEVGRTPNPDVMCNSTIKFGAFFNWACAEGFESIATGHHARVATDTEGQAHLLRGCDPRKDQSYFLWKLTQKQLSKTHFPVGDYQKTEVRRLARERGLPTAAKKDSQGVCFLGKLDMASFLQHYLPKTEGEVLSQNGKTIGTHDGAIFYTLGQRHGFRITNSTPHQEPLYVIARDRKANTIAVAPRAVLDARPVPPATLEDVNWIVAIPQLPMSAEASARYHQRTFSVTLTKRSEGIEVTTEEKGVALPPGQSLVLYRGDECLGGGVLSEASLAPTGEPQ